MNVAPGQRWTSTDLGVAVSMLGALAPVDDDAARVDRIAVLERLRSAVAAAQLAETARFVASQRAAQAVFAGDAAAGPIGPIGSAGAVGAQGRSGRGVVEQVALARRISPFAARRFVSVATRLTRDLPATFTELAAGRTSEARAVTVARETGWLQPADAARIDADLAPRLCGWGDRQVDNEVRRAAYRADPHGYVEHLRVEPGQRRVTVRPCPDLMARVTATLPLAQGVACYAALCRDTDTLVVTSGTSTASVASEVNGRTRSQLMADLFVERLTGTSATAGTPVEINLIMTDRTLLSGATSPDPGHGAQVRSADARDAGTRDEPAVLLAPGLAPVVIPAQTARELITDPPDTTPIWLRRLYVTPPRDLHGSPHGGQLAAMDTHRRIFTTNQRRFLRLRDQYCATPWCGAPIRHADHLIPAAHGGPTTITNGRGLCQTCNHARQAPGWTAHRPDANTTETVTTTPTGHRYTHHPPAPPGSRPDPSTRPAAPQPAASRPAATLHPVTRRREACGPDRARRIAHCCARRVRPRPGARQ